MLVSTTHFIWWSDAAICVQHGVSLFNKLPGPGQGAALSNTVLGTGLHVYRGCMLVRSSAEQGEQRPACTSASSSSGRLRSSGKASLGCSAPFGFLAANVEGKNAGGIGPEGVWRDFCPSKMTCRQLPPFYLSVKNGVIEWLEVRRDLWRSFGPNGKHECSSSSTADHK